MKPETQKKRSLQAHELEEGIPRSQGEKKMPGVIVNQF